MLIDAIRSINKKEVIGLSKVRESVTDLKVEKKSQKDSVSISEEGKELMLNTERVKKIEDLKRRINLGEYSIDAYELSQKILYSMRGE